MFNEKKSYTIVCMKLILVKLIPGPSPFFHRQRMPFTNFLWCWRNSPVHFITSMNDRGKYIWLKPLKALFICWSAVDILSFCSWRSAGNNHCKCTIKTNTDIKKKTAKILTFTVIFSKQIPLLVRVRTKSGL